MSTVFSEGRRLGDWLKGETERPDRYDRDAVTILAGETLVTGTVLGKITASGKFVGLDLGATDGSQHAAGILITDSVEGDTTADADAVALTRGPAVINASYLTWPTGASDGEKTTALGELADLGIIAREAA